MSAEVEWTHDGKRVPEDWDFFVAAPACIGALISGETSLRRNQQPMSRAAYFGWVISVSVMFGLTAAAVADTDRWTAFAIYTLLSMPFTAFAFLFIVFEHECSYVGQNGIARYRIRNSRTAKVRTEVLLFENAAACFNRFWPTLGGNSRCLEWKDANGKRLVSFEIVRTAFSLANQSQHRYRFARAAEYAWVSHLQNRLSSVLHRRGAILFPMLRNDFIEVTNDQLVIMRHRKRLELKSAEIKSISLVHDHFRIQTLEAGLLTMHGHIVFPYGELGNAAIFLSIVSIYMAVTIKAPGLVSKCPDDML